MTNFDPDDVPPFDDLFGKNLHANLRLFTVAVQEYGLSEQDVDLIAEYVSSDPSRVINEALEYVQIQKKTEKEYIVDILLPTIRLMRDVKDNL